MVSAIVVLPARSMVTVSSAFMSSTRARTRRRVSLASGRTRETLDARGVREIAEVGRGPCPFVAAPARKRAVEFNAWFNQRVRYAPKIGTGGLWFQPPAIRHGGPSSLGALIRS